MKKILFLFIVTLIFISCNKESQTLTKVASKLSISQADFLILKQNEGGSKSNLFKLNEKNGSFEEYEVFFQNKDGETIDSTFATANISDIFKLSDDLICLKGDFKLYLSENSEQQSLTSILVRISDGAIFDFNNHFPSQDSTWDTYAYLQFNLTQKDSLENIYYLYNNNIIKLSKNGNSYTQEDYLPIGEEYFKYYIDRNGNCYYNTQGALKIKKKLGGILQKEMIDINTIWTSYNGNVMYFNGNELGNVTFNNTDITLTALASYSFDLSTTDYSKYTYSNNDTKTTILVSPDYLSRIGKIVFEESNKIYNLNFPEIGTLDYMYMYILKLVDNTLFIVDNNNTSFKEIYKIDLSQYTKINDNTYGCISYEHIQIPDDIKITGYVITDNKEILFEGYRFSDEKNITGLISKTNEIQILSVSNDKKFKKLTRL